MRFKNMAHNFLFVSGKISGVVHKNGESRLFNSGHLTANQVADVHLFPMFKDNYGFIMVDTVSGFAACVDAGDGDAVNNFLKDNKISLTSLLCTHKHNDHVGGNAKVNSMFPSIEVIGSKYEEIPLLSKPVGEGDSFRFGSLNVEVLHVPCHTKGHIAYYITKTQDDSIQSSSLVDQPLAPLLFCGDTLFVGGCGRFFEGTAADMLRNMDRFALLPHNTVVYCAHEYTESNLKFLAHIDPEQCSDRYTEVKRLRALNIPTVPTTIGEELKYNLFMKCHEERTQRLVGASSAVQAMHFLRNMKNYFQQAR